jgi:hypothetical protein
MINWTKTRMLWSEPALILPSQLSSIQEGMPLVSCMYQGQIAYQPAQGATTGIGSTKLAGIAMSPRRTFSDTNGAVTITAPAGGGIVSLPVTVLSNSDVGVFNSSGTAMTVATSGSTGASTVVVTTDATTGLTDVNFDPSMAGSVFNVFYNYAMSPLVEQALFGNTSPGFFASDVLGAVGMFKIGRISLNNFDPAANWYAGTNTGVKVIAGGLFTDFSNSAAGFNPTNVEIVQLPTPAYPWLEIIVSGV